MKKSILLAIIAILFNSCAVQQFPVNTTVQPFANGGAAFGEKTRGIEYKKRNEFFIIGINISDCDTKEMAEKLKATSYTIETKHNFVSVLIHLATFGIFDHKVVKVIKRDH